MKLVLLALALGWTGTAFSQEAQPRQTERYCTDGRHRQLDFWVGDWDLEWNGGVAGTEKASSRVSRDEFGSCAIVERMEWPDGQYRTIGLSMFDSHSALWRQTFIDNEGNIVSLSGGPQQDGTFILVADRPDSRGRQRRMVWTDVKPNSLVWRWERRTRNDQPWEADWVVRYSRR